MKSLEKDGTPKAPALFGPVRTSGGYRPPDGGHMETDAGNARRERRTRDVLNHATSRIVLLVRL